MLLGGTIATAVPPRVFAGRTSTAPESPIPVRFTDVRESAKIAFQRDSTQTEEKYYLETMGTGVGWIDYDQDGLMEQAKGGASYMSASDPRIHFGLGKRTKIDSLEITWPSGQMDRLSNVSIDQIIAVKEGGGIVPRQFPRIPSSK